MTRVPFKKLFEENSDGSLNIKPNTKCSGLTFLAGVHISKGILLGGIDWQLFKNRDLAVEYDGDITVIIGIF